MLKSVKVSKLISALNKLGFSLIRQKGSHMFFEHSDGRTTVVPNHKEIRIKLLTKIAKDVKLEKDEFIELIK